MTLWQSIFLLKALGMHHYSTQIHEKDPENPAEVIRPVEKLSSVHQLTATLTPSTFSMMSSDDSDDSVLSVDGQVILATIAWMPSVMAVMNLVILPRTAPSGFLHQEHHATMEDLILGIDTPTTRGTDHTPIMVPDVGDITADHSPTPVHTMTEATTLEGTPHTLLPATTATHTTLQPMEASTVITTGIVVPHPILTISLHVPLTPLHRSETLSLLLCKAVCSICGMSRG